MFSRKTAVCKTTDELKEKYPKLLINNVSTSVVAEFSKHGSALTQAFIKEHLNWKLACNLFIYPLTKDILIQLLNMSDDKTTLLDCLCIPDPSVLSDKEKLAFLEFAVSLYSAPRLSDSTLEELQKHQLHQKIATLVKDNHLENKKFFMLYTKNEKFYYMFQVGEISLVKYESNICKNIAALDLKNTPPWAIIDLDLCRLELSKNYRVHFDFLIRNHGNLLNQDLFNETNYINASTPSTLFLSLKKHLPPKDPHSLDIFKELFHFYEQIMLWFVTLDISTANSYDHQHRELTTLFQKYLFTAYKAYGNDIQKILSPIASIFLRLHLPTEESDLSEFDIDLGKLVQASDILEEAFTDGHFTLDLPSIKSIIVYITNNNLIKNQSNTPLVIKKMIALLLEEGRFKELDELTSSSPISTTEEDKILSILKESIVLHIKSKIKKFSHETYKEEISKLIEYAKTYCKHEASYLEALLIMNTDPSNAAMLFNEVSENADDKELADSATEHLTNLIYTGQVHTLDKEGKVSFPATSDGEMIDYVEQAIQAYEVILRISPENRKEISAVYHIIQSLLQNGSHQASKEKENEISPLETMPLEVQKHFRKYYFHRLSTTCPIEETDRFDRITQCLLAVPSSSLEEFQTIFNRYQQIIGIFLSKPLERENKLEKANEFFTRCLIHAYQHYGNDIQTILPPISLVFLKLHLIKRENKEDEPLIKLLEESLKVAPVDSNDVITTRLIIYMKNFEIYDDKHETIFFIKRTYNTFLENENYKILGNIQENIPHYHDIDIDAIYHDCISNHIQRTIESISDDNSIEDFSALFDFAKNHTDIPLLITLFKMRENPVEAAIQLDKSTKITRNDHLRDIANYHLANLMFTEKVAIELDKKGNVSYVNPHRKEDNSIEQAIQAYEFVINLNPDKKENKDLLSNVLTTLESSSSQNLSDIPFHVERPFFRYYLKRLPSGDVPEIISEILLTHHEQKSQKELRSPTSTTLFQSRETKATQTDSSILSCKKEEKPAAYSIKN